MSSTVSIRSLSTRVFFLRMRQSSPCAAQQVLVVPVEALRDVALEQVGDEVGLDRTVPSARRCHAHVATPCGRCAASASMPPNARCAGGTPGLRGRCGRRSTSATPRSAGRWCTRLPSPRTESSTRPSASNSASQSSQRRSSTHSASRYSKSVTLCSKAASLIGRPRCEPAFINSAQRPCWAMKMPSSDALAPLLPGVDAELDGQVVGAGNLVRLAARHVAPAHHAVAGCSLSASR